MFEYWYGLYLKSTIKRTRLEFVKAFEEREYILEQEYDEINEDALFIYGSQKYYWETHILLFLTQSVSFLTIISSLFTTSLSMLEAFH